MCPFPCFISLNDGLMELFLWFLVFFHNSVCARCILSKLEDSYFLIFCFHSYGSYRSVEVGLSFYPAYLTNHHFQPTTGLWWYVLYSNSVHCEFGPAWIVFSSATSFGHGLMDYFFSPLQLIYLAFITPVVYDFYNYNMEKSEFVQLFMKFTQVYTQFSLFGDLPNLPYPANVMK